MLLLTKSLIYYSSLFLFQGKVHTNLIKDNRLFYIFILKNYICVNDNILDIFLIDLVYCM